MDDLKVAGVIAPMLPGGATPKLARWLTFALNQRTRGVNVSSDGVNKGLGGACNAHMTLLAAFIALSDLQISVRSRGNRST